MSHPVSKKQTAEHFSGQPSIAASSASSEHIRSAGIQKHLLVVDDDPVNLELAALFLERLGYPYDVVGNGNEALRMLGERDYDLVLLDCVMPEMSGEEVAANIRDPESKVRNHAVPIIALTGRLTLYSPDVFLTKGMNDCLAKPYYIQDLKAVLVKWLPDLQQNDGSKGANQADLPGQSTADETVSALFVEKAPEYIAALQSCVMAGDAAGVQFHAHRLAGAAGVIGACTVAGLAAELEELSMCNEMEKAGQRLQHLSEAFGNLMAILTRNS